MLHVFVSAPVLLSIPMFLPSPLSTSTASYQSEMDMNQSTLTKVKYVPPRKSHASSHHEKHREAPRSYPRPQGQRCLCCSQLAIHHPFSPVRSGTAGGRQHPQHPACVSPPVSPPPADWRHFGEPPFEIALSSLDCHLSPSPRRCLSLETCFAHLPSGFWARRRNIKWNSLKPRCNSLKWKLCPALICAVLFFTVSGKRWCRSKWTVASAFTSLILALDYANIAFNDATWASELRIVNGQGQAVCLTGVDVTCSSAFWRRAHARRRNAFIDLYICIWKWSI